MNPSPIVGPRRKTIPSKILLKVAASCVATLALSAAALAADASFYTATRKQLAGKPGTVIRTEPLTTSVPPGATAYRILYRSTGLHGEHVAVSAVVAIPEGAAPAEGRPIVSWQHPTSGVDVSCAPSLSPSALQMIMGLPEMLRRGYVVVATDYPGMGTSGPHPYLVGISEGRAALDAVRAVRHLPRAHAGNRFALWGHSQGGQASLFAASLASSYAPELRLVGVAAAAPATDLAALSKDVTASYSSQLLSAMLMWSWSRVYNAPLGSVVAPADLPAVNLLARQCFDPPLDSATQPEGKPLPQVGYKLTSELTTTAPWNDLLERNSARELAPEIPVFLAQGAADTTIPPAVTAAYMQRLCGKGSAVRMVTLPGVEHRPIAYEAENDAVNWITDRFGGKSAPNDCK